MKPVWLNMPYWWPSLVNVSAGHSGILRTSDGRTDKPLRLVSARGVAFGNRFFGLTKWG